MEISMSHTRVPWKIPPQGEACFLAEKQNASCLWILSLKIISMILDFATCLKTKLSLFLGRCGSIRRGPPASQSRYFLATKTRLILAMNFATTRRRRCQIRDGKVAAKFKSLRAGNRAEVAAIRPRSSPRLTQWQAQNSSAKAPANLLPQMNQSSWCLLVNGILILLFKKRVKILSHLQTQLLGTRMTYNPGWCFARGTSRSRVNWQYKCFPRRAGSCASFQGKNIFDVNQKTITPSSRLLQIGFYISYGWFWGWWKTVWIPELPQGSGGNGRYGKYKQN